MFTLQLPLSDRKMKGDMFYLAWSTFETLGSTWTWIPPPTNWCVSCGSSSGWLQKTSSGQGDNKQPELGIRHEKFLNNPKVRFESKWQINVTELWNLVKIDLSFQRLNVNITRVKVLMIIIGNPKTLQHDRYWFELPVAARRNFNWPVGHNKASPCWFFLPLSQEPELIHRRLFVTCSVKNYF
jgi:hypothetical protein